MRQSSCFYTHAYVREREIKKLKIERPWLAHVCVCKHLKVYLTSSTRSSIRSSTRTVQANTVTKKTNICLQQNSLLRLFLRYCTMNMFNHVRMFTHYSAGQQWEWQLRVRSGGMARLRSYVTHCPTLPSSKKSTLKFVVKYLWQFLNSVTLSYFGHSHSRASLGPDGTK